MRDWQEEIRKNILNSFVYASSAAAVDTTLRGRMLLDAQLFDLQAARHHIDQAIAMVERLIQEEAD